MTFNTTSLPLWQALQNGRLLVKEPSRRFGEHKRFILVTPEVLDLLEGRAQFGNFPTVASESLIAKFTAGWLVTVSRQKTERKPDVEQLVGYDEVWALCPRTPRPGWRILGRFYDRNQFIGLRAWDKQELYSNYDRAAAEVISDWESLFGDTPPHRGTEIGDYLSKVFKDVDED